MNKYVALVVAFFMFLWAMQMLRATTIGTVLKPMNVEI